MPVEPHYGETPLDADELENLTAEARELLGNPVTLAEVYDLELGISTIVTETALRGVIDGELGLETLLSDTFLRDLHDKLYGEIWTWAGTFRSREINIGIAPELISVELRNALGNITYRWFNTADWSARELGIAVHAELARIHPFVDGNGRSTRLLADLVYATAQSPGEFSQYDWNVDKRVYIELLRAYDGHRDPRTLAAFIPTRLLEES